MAKKDIKMPIYLQLREIIRNKIEEGEYLPGTAIPSENKLAETFGINRITIRNAVDVLAKEGILKRIQGKGVFVVGQKNEIPIEYHGGFISDSLKNDSRIFVKELQKTTRQAGNKYANMFNIDLDDEIVYFKHLIYISNVETAIEEYFVSKDILPSLDTINTSVFSFNDVLSFYGVKLKKMTQNLKIVKGQSKTRKLLNTPNKVQLFLLKCNFFDESGRIIAHSITNIRSDMQSFTVNLHK